MSQTREKSESGQMALEKWTNFESIFMTNNVKSCKKINEKGKTFRFSVFSMGRQEIFAKNMENLAN